MSLDLSVARDKENDVSVVLVVGEAARRKSMGVYGAAFNTTPFYLRCHLNQRIKLRFFRCCNCCAIYQGCCSVIAFDGWGTRLHKDRAHPSIYKILNQAGVISTLVSKNHGVTLHEQLIDVIVKDNANAVGGASIYDVDLLAHMSDALAESDSGSDFITLRLLGSHQRYKDRYPSDHDCFSPDTPEANYLSSIRYTDADRHG
ncbi:sulfatase-like hydrolase/transferase [Candidatus Reidiella endopervernicosa]|uniref:Sulfatase-like hydrolase/transferase n=1 Tax=Candidatus Reidiella endopervernicosa TaxID=2738883 RepID=A0A6N0HXL6_9GAMM|nr:sulfatase-like hydrolase/transferase [Candidatus Reidiella endopervernicosa]QKQ26916.1 sulfatase-like hydrolase/transferase [Candidatus Reidiella endopervernicosa]